MGKGDKKTRRGKIILGSFGVRRPRKNNIKPAVKPEKDVRAKEEKTAVVKEVKETKPSRPAGEKPATKSPKPAKEKKEIKEEKAEKEQKPRKEKKS